MIFPKTFHSRPPRNSHTQTLSHSRVHAQHSASRYEPQLVVTPPTSFFCGLQREPCVDATKDGKRTDSNFDYYPIREDPITRGVANRGKLGMNVEGKHGFLPGHQQTVPIKYRQRQEISRRGVSTTGHK